MSGSLILTPVDGAAGDFFGSSVSFSADGLTAIVGGPNDGVGANAFQGSARVFVWNGSAWVQRGDALTPLDGAAGDYFGNSVSLSADGLTAIVGGQGDNVGAGAFQGSARVFDWNGSAWTQRGGAITPPDPASQASSFGGSVSLSADGLTAILGGIGDAVGANATQGSARVFDWTGTAWVQRGGALTPSDGAANDLFGASVSLSADGLIAMVGGHFDDVGFNVNQGSARVFAWNGNAWVQRGGALTPIDGAVNDQFGFSVSLSANGLTAIVGGYGDDVGANVDQGSARVFDWNGSAWVQRGGALTPTDGAAGDFFGTSVSLSANGLTAIVGGYIDDVGANADQGSARVFDWNGSAWVQRGVALTPSDGAAGDYFGRSVSLSADGLIAIVGGAGDNVGANVDQGSARLFAWNGSAWVEGAPASAVHIAATSASKPEGQSGTTSYTFTATRTGDTSVVHTVAWAVTGSGTNAAVAADFVGGVLSTGTVSFAIGETSKTITIDVAGDTSGETDEGFTVTLSTPSTALVIGTSAATGTIINDDAWIGTPNADTLTGLAGNDTLNGLSGNDTLDGGSGDDVLTGSNGRDVAIFSGTRAQTSLHHEADGSWTATGPNGTDKLAGIEVARFTDADVSFVLPHAKDFSGDGYADILWRNDNGAVWLYQMQGFSVVGQGGPGTVSAAWHIERSGDLNGDGHADILWRHDDGGLYAWTMNGTAIMGGVALGNPGNDWQVIGFDDFNGDGRSDLLFRHTDGTVYWWGMDGGTIQQQGIISQLDPSVWQLSATADLNGDGNADMLWRANNGAFYSWLMQGGSIIGGLDFGVIDPAWKLAGTGDLNADGNADLIWRNGEGAVYYWLMDGGSIVGQGSAGVVGTDWNIAQVSDFSGDGKDDILWRNDNGALYLWQMNGATITSQGSVGYADPTWHIQ